MSNEEAIRDYHAHHPHVVREVGEATKDAEAAVSNAKTPEEREAADEAVTRGRRVAGAYGKDLGSAMENRSRGLFRR